MRTPSIPDIFRSDPFRSDITRNGSARRRLPDLWWMPLDGDTFLCVDEVVEDGTLKLRVDAPGIDPSSDVDLRLVDHHLDLRVTRQERTETGDAHHRHSEVRYGTFRRTLPIPKGTNADAVAATYHDGVLEISVPAGEQPHAEKIEVVAP